MNRDVLFILVTDGKLYHEKLSLSQDVAAVSTSLRKPSTHEWMFTDTKHMIEIYTSDDELLRTLDNIGNTILNPQGHDDLSAEIDLLSAQFDPQFIYLMNRIAEVQLRVFTAQISHAYLTSLSQPPTPRSQSNYTLSELKNLQVELDGLVLHCEEATRLLSRQNVMDRVSDALLRGRVERMEKELDGVERIEDVMEGMVGRMTVARDLLVLEMSKLNALGQILSQLGEKITTPAQQLKGPGSNQLLLQRDTETTADTAILQSLIGIRNVDDVRKILFKGDRLDRELYDSSIQHVTNSVNETYTPVFNGLTIQEEYSRTINRSRVCRECNT